MTPSDRVGDFAYEAEPTRFVVATKVTTVPVFAPPLVFGWKVKVTDPGVLLDAGHGKVVWMMSDFVPNSVKVWTATPDDRVTTIVPPLSVPVFPLPVFLVIVTLKVAVPEVAPAAHVTLIGLVAVAK